MHRQIAGKLTGNDAIVVHGACEAPSALIVDGDGARMVDAGDLWGLPAAEAEARLRARLGPGVAVTWRRVDAIPAGRSGKHRFTVSDVPFLPAAGAASRSGP